MTPDQIATWRQQTGIEPLEWVCTCGFDDAPTLATAALAHCQQEKEQGKNMEITASGPVLAEAREVGQVAGHSTHAELLAALKVVTYWLEAQRDYGHGNAYPEEYAAVDQAKAAIARAEGQ